MGSRIQDGITFKRGFLRRADKAKLEVKEPRRSRLVHGLSQLSWDSEKPNSDAILYSVGAMLFAKSTVYSVQCSILNEKPPCRRPSRWSIISWCRIDTEMEPLSYYISSGPVYLQAAIKIQIRYLTRTPFKVPTPTLHHLRLHPTTLPHTHRSIADRTKPSQTPHNIQFLPALFLLQKKIQTVPNLDSHPPMRLKKTSFTRSDSLRHLQATTATGLPSNVGLATHACSGKDCAFVVNEI